MMKTPLRTRLGDARPRYQEAESLRHQFGIYAHARTVEALTNEAAAVWTHVERELQIQNMLRFELRNSLDLLVAWLQESVTEIFYSEFMFELRVKDGKIVAPARRHINLEHQINRLYNLFGRIVHVLQQDWTGPNIGLPDAQGPLPDDMAADQVAQANYELAQYAELIASQARFCMGPLLDERYHHPARRKWTEIHYRTKRRLANMAQRWSDEDAAIMAKFDRGNS